MQSLQWLAYFHVSLIKDVNKHLNKGNNKCLNKASSGKNAKSLDISEEQSIFIYVHAAFTQPQVTFKQSCSYTTALMS